MGPAQGEAAAGQRAGAGTRFRWLVMAELALAMMLVMGASLMVKSAVRMAAFDFGYDARGLLRAQIVFPQRFVYSWDRLEYYKDTLTDSAKTRLNVEVLARVGAIPGVRSVAKFSGCNLKSGVVTTDRTVEGGEAGYVPTHCNTTSAGLFATFGIKIADGRDFIEGDDATGCSDSRRRTGPHDNSIRTNARSDAR